MLTVYFIRHGQAGSRQDYDCLSELGRAQSRHLGAWIARQRIRFDQAWSGCLSRQRETAELVRAACRGSHTDFPEITVDPCWNEFDLDVVYNGIAPQLARDDQEFRRQYEDMQIEMMDAGSRVHHAWAPCDTAVVRAWIERRYDCPGESFETFAARVCAAERMLRDGDAPRHVAVFTSATPAAVWSAMALELDKRKVMQLAGVTFNTSLTVMRIEGERLRLFQFNTVPHLDSPELLTQR